MKTRLYHTFLMNMVIVSAASVYAMCPEEQGMAIAKAMQAQASGWQDIQSDIEMILRSPNGKENTMVLSSKTLEVKNDGDKTRIEFKQPQSVAGTTLLSHSHLKEDDEQWLFMPKNKRVQRIAGKSKSGAFLGSQYSFEDLSSFKVEKYRYRFLREEPCDTQTCSVLAIYPEYRGSGYSKMIAWIDAVYRIQTVEYYDRDDELLKILTVKEYKKIADKFWQPVHSEVVNQQNGKSTVMVITDIQLATGLTSADFDKSLLK
jgi:outer membrane lipoprotein-sorting protein